MSHVVERRDAMLTAQSSGYKNRPCKAVRLHLQLPPLILITTLLAISFHPRTLLRTLILLFSMKFSTLSVLLSAATFALAAPSSSTKTSGKATVSYDETYDNASGSLSTVACSDGSHGLLTKGKLYLLRICCVSYHSPLPLGYNNFGDLPGFPNIGGSFAVGGWNSAECGTCWKLTYHNKSINVLAVDHADAGEFNIALAAMNKLTGNQAKDLGRVTVTYEQVSTSNCK